MITNSNTSSKGVLDAPIANYAGGLVLTSPGDLVFQQMISNNNAGATLTWNSTATLTLGTANTTDHFYKLQLHANNGTVELNVPYVASTGANPMAVDRNLYIGDPVTLGTAGLVKLTGTSNNQINDVQLVQIDYGALDFNGHNETIGGVQSTYPTGYIQNSAVGTTSVVTINTTSATAGVNTFNGIIQDHDPAGTGGIVAVTKTGADGTEVLDKR